MLFWSRLGVVLGPKLASFSAKFRLQTVLGSVSHRKRRFPRNHRKTNTKSTKMPSGTLPKPHRIDPSRSQEANFSLLNFDFDFGSILVPFWLPKCLPLGTLLATQIDQKNDSKFDCSKCRLKIATRPPKTPPGPPQERPKTPQDHPKTRQELPKRPPRPPKMPSRAPKIASRLPKILPRDPQVVPRNRHISSGRLRLHDARIRTNNERMMNE